ncbi:hypothetical protein DID78_03865 [Candidatus Marinamargulisbacteria bacterium SCGC AG-343-D04]|nr:hypothetical protein DID78_03865 [Candidatus Marinamargulisbacteria bacterium SCGC AG-343-D04]
MIKAILTISMLYLVMTTSYASTKLSQTDVWYLSFLPENYDVVVGVMDTKINKDHPLLTEFIYRDKNNNNSDNKGVDKDGKIHGTSVASIIASSQDETFNVHGISRKPGKIKLLPIKMVKEMTSIDDDLHQYAMDYAIKMDVDIINASFADYSISKELGGLYQQAFDQGIVVVASAGNSAVKESAYPCVFEESICVGGMLNKDRLWEHSSSGNTDFVAYVDVLLIDENEIGFKGKQGTSYSAAIISGAIAKIMSYTGDFSKEYSYNLLKKYAVKIDGAGDRDGYGYIDFKALVEEFLIFEDKFITHPDNPDLAYHFVVVKEAVSPHKVVDFVLKNIIRGDKTYPVNKLVGF